MSKYYCCISKIFSKHRHLYLIVPQTIFSNYFLRLEKKSHLYFLHIEKLNSGKRQKNLQIFNREIKLCLFSQNLRALKKIQNNNNLPTFAIFVQNYVNFFKPSSSNFMLSQLNNTSLPSIIMEAISDELWIFKEKCDFFLVGGSIT